MTNPDGSDKLFNDSKLGLGVTALLTIVFDGALKAVLEAGNNVDTSGWNGWWSTVASAVLATVIGALTAYKAKRDRSRL